MCASNSSHPPSDGSSETRRWVGLPMYLVEEEEVEDLLHPEVAITRRANAPENDPGTRSIIFRQEDYTESGDDNFEYIGLVRLEPASVEYDEELTAEELRDARASEPEEYDFPPRLECPGCGGTVEKLDAVSDYESCPYMCSDCSRLMLLERRNRIRNAAALLMSRYVPDPD